MMSFLDKYYYPPVHLFTLWFSEAMLYNLKFNESKIPAGSKIMDVGCGLGYHCQNLYKFGVNEALGVDISQETIDLLNTFKTISIFRKIDICKDDISEYNDKFDVIFSSDVYEHVQDPDIMLQNLYRMLKKGGVISVTFPNWLHHGQNQFKDVSEFEEKLSNAGFRHYNISVIKDYSIPYKIFMQLYKIAQKLSDKFLRIKRVEFQGSGMPESDEFHEMYAYKKIEKIKKFRMLCISLNLSYRFIAALLKIRPPYQCDNDNSAVLGKRVMVFAVK